MLAVIVMQDNPTQLEKPNKTTSYLNDVTDTDLSFFVPTYAFHFCHKIKRMIANHYSAILPTASKLSAIILPN